MMSAQSSTYLPHHSESATDVLGGRLGGVNRGGAGFCTNGETQSKSSYEEVGPVVCRAHPDTGNRTDSARDKDSSTTSEEFLGWYISTHVPASTLIWRSNSH